MKILTNQLHKCSYETWYGSYCSATVY